MSSAPRAYRTALQAGQRAADQGLGVTHQRARLLAAAEQVVQALHLQRVGAGRHGQVADGVAHAAGVGVLEAGSLEAGDRDAAGPSGKYGVISLTWPVSSRTTFSANAGSAYCWQAFVPSCFVLPPCISVGQRHDRDAGRPQLLLDLGRHRLGVQLAGAAHHAHRAVLLGGPQLGDAGLGGDAHPPAEGRAAHDAHRRSRCRTWCSCSAGRRSRWSRRRRRPRPARRRPGPPPPARRRSGSTSVTRAWVRTSTPLLSSSSLMAGSMIDDVVEVGVLVPGEGRRSGGAGWRR